MERSPAFFSVSNRHVQSRRGWDVEPLPRDHPLTFGIMQHVNPISLPVVTLLSRSPAVSRRTQSLLQSLFGMKPIDMPLKYENGDVLERAFPSFLGGRNKWESVASQCVLSGTVLHLLSPPFGSDADGNTKDRKRSPDLSLLSVTQGVRDGESAADATAAASVQESRRRLALHVRELGSNSVAMVMKMTIGTAMGWQFGASHLFGNGVKEGLPLLDLPSKDGNHNAVPLWQADESAEMRARKSFRLREVVLPYFDDASYEDGSSLLSRFRHSALSRPLVGMYQWPQNSVAFRPLPAAKEDMALPPPSLVFQCESLDDAQKAIDDSGAKSAKVGFTGHDRKGQLIVRHELLLGIDVRICEASNFSSTFAEAQESLLAGSLDDLQSENVMAEGGKGMAADKTDSFGRSDSMNGLGDCWIGEFMNICVSFLVVDVFVIYLTVALCMFCGVLINSFRQ